MTIEVTLTPGRNLIIERGKDSLVLDLDEAAMLTKILKEILFALGKTIDQKTM